MLTLLSFLSFVWITCIYLLANRYKIYPKWVTFLAVTESCLLAVVVGMEQDYQIVWYLVALNVSLLSALLIIYCLGSKEKQEWTEHVSNAVRGIRTDFKSMRSEYEELSKRIK